MSDDVSGILVALVPVLGCVGGAIAFIWNKVEKRFEHVERELEHCQTREDESLERRSVLYSVIELLWQEVQRHAPGSLALRRAKKLMEDLKQGHATVELTKMSKAMEDLIAKDATRATD